MSETGRARASRVPPSLASYSANIESFQSGLMYLSATRPVGVTSNSEPTGTIEQAVSCSSFGLSAMNGC